MFLNIFIFSNYFDFEKFVFSHYIRPWNFFNVQFCRKQSTVGQAFDAKITLIAIFSWREGGYFLRSDQNSLFS